MNTRQLNKLGVPPQSIPTAIACLQAAARANELRGLKPKKLIPKIVAAPDDYLDHRFFAEFARSLQIAANEPPPPDPIDFQQWGEEIDQACRNQMTNACHLPVATAAALMPDAHLGYGLPIGGVLACDNAVVPYAVGVDIACRMRLTLTDLDPNILDENDSSQCRELDKSLRDGTRFGQGCAWTDPYDHDVLDEDWSITSVTRRVRDKARQQLGTSGSGNHFVEWGIVELPSEELDLPAGRYVALLSHSGSRGAGAQVCRRYTEIATRNMPDRYRNDARMKHLGWLSLDSHEGQEYWAAMNLMGRYAAANHEVIHQNVTRKAGAKALSTVENHHNFAWKETLDGHEVIVHRKGATPAHAGQLGVIPGSMADPAFIVRGRGVAESVNSASHGAGRRMSRSAAKQQFRWNMWQDYLDERHVRVLAGSVDELPGAYKNIHDVMQAQSNLVEVLGTFQPKIVMMSG